MREKNKLASGYISELGAVEAMCNKSADLLRGKVIADFILETLANALL